MKRVLNKIKWWGSFLLVVLGLIEYFTKISIFFRPLWHCFNQKIEIKFGIIIFLEFLILFFLISWLKLKNKYRNIKKTRKIEDIVDTASNKKWKTSFEEFPEEGILYALEYPLGKDDVEPWIGKSDPRCLKCQTRMKKMPTNHNPFALTIWKCESCGHSIEDEENSKLQTQAKSRLVKRLNNKS